MRQFRGVGLSPQLLMDMASNHDDRPRLRVQLLKRTLPELEGDMLDTVTEHFGSVLEEQPSAVKEAVVAAYADWLS